MPPTTKILTRHERELATTLVKLDMRITSLEAENEAIKQILTSEVEELWLVVKEINYRNLFAMQYFKFKKKVPTGLLDGAGQAITEDAEITLWDVYNSQRDSFVEKVEADLAARKASEDAQSDAAAAPDAQPTGECADETVAGEESRAGNKSAPVVGKFGAH